MKSSAPLLTPILRSETQGRLLAHLMLHPERELSLTELAARSDVAAPTIMRDVNRLVDGGFVLDRRVGRSRLLQANVAHPLFEPLREIVLFGYGPVAVLPHVLADIHSIEQAFVFGSWAERYSGVAGEAPADVDVLLVGEVDRAEAYEAARQAADLVGREVNVTVVSRERWEASDDGFVRTVKSRPLVPISLELSE